jgi:hypothetical protein
MAVSGQLHASAALAIAKEPPFPIIRKLGGSQSIWTLLVKEKSFCPFRKANAFPTLLSPVI